MSNGIEEIIVSETMDDNISVQTKKQTSPIGSVDIITKIHANEGDAPLSKLPSDSRPTAVHEGACHICGEVTGDITRFIHFPVRVSEKNSGWSHYDTSPMLLCKSCFDRYINVCKYTFGEVWCGHDTDETVYRCKKPRKPLSLEERAYNYKRHWYGGDTSFWQEFVRDNMDHIAEGLAAMGLGIRANADLPLARDDDQTDYVSWFA